MPKTIVEKTIGEKNYWTSLSSGGGKKLKKE